MITFVIGFFAGLTLGIVITAWMMTPGRPHHNGKYPPYTGQMDTFKD